MRGKGLEEPQLVLTLLLNAAETGRVPRSYWPLQPPLEPWMQLSDFKISTRLIVAFLIVALIGGLAGFCHRPDEPTERGERDAL